MKKTSAYSVMIVVSLSHSYRMIGLLSICIAFNGHLQLNFFLSCLLVIQPEYLRSSFYLSLKYIWSMKCMCLCKYWRTVCRNVCVRRMSIVDTFRLISKSIQWHFRNRIRRHHSWHQHFLTNVIQRFIRLQLFFVRWCSTWVSYYWHECFICHS